MILGKTVSKINKYAYSYMSLQKCSLFPNPAQFVFQNPYSFMQTELIERVNQAHFKLKFSPRTFPHACYRNADC